MNIHWIIAIGSLCIFVGLLIGLVIGGWMHAAKRADTFIEPGDLMDENLGVKSLSKLKEEKGALLCPICSLPMDYRNKPWWNCSHCHYAILDGEKPNLLRDRTVVVQESHTLPVDGSIPSPAPNFPRYFVACEAWWWTETVYLKVVSPTSSFRFFKSGESSESGMNLEDCIRFVEQGHWKELTEPEAKALITLPSGLVAPRETEAGK